MTLRIRGGQPDDYGRLLIVWRAAVEASHSFLTPADIDVYEDVVARYLPQLSDLRVAEDGSGAPIGFIAQDGGEIHMLFVAPSAQGCGVGTALLEDVAAAYDVLLLDVNEHNPAALGFYRARGFEQIGRSAVDTEGRPFPLLHLRRGQHTAQIRPPS